jgi:chemotaxis protein MotB
MDLIRTGGNLPERVVGELKVLSMEDRTATALITKSVSRILKGDRFRVKSHTPDVLPISQSLPQPLDVPPAVVSSPNKLQFQHVAGETRVSLNDLMKQLRFESGESTIKSEGYQVLDELIAYLKTTAGDKLIRIEGHADNMEIGPSLQSTYQTNWDLSKARARVVLRYLLEKGGIDSAKLSSVGYGDTKPVAGNATEEGRQRNRRVDIVLYSPESLDERSAPAAKQPGADGTRYNLSRLSSEESGASVTGADRMIPVTQTSLSKAEVTPISDSPASAVVPTSGGQGQVDQNPRAPGTPEK